MYQEGSRKRNLFVSIFILLSISVVGQIDESKLLFPKSDFGEQVVTYTGFNLMYSEEFEQARWVSYYLTKERANGTVSRKDNFRPDPHIKTGSAMLSDYRSSGYDRGHLAPAGDMKWSALAMSESFYLSNMSPQLPGFNRGIWKNLESLVRQFAIDNERIFVVTGPILTHGLPTIGPNEVAIPEYYYKVILDYDEPEYKAIGFILPDEKSSLELSSFVVSVDEVEAKTNLDFFSALPDYIENILEAESSYSSWTNKVSIVSTDSIKKLDVSVRCAGTTKSGQQCKRMTKYENGYCWQHQAQAAINSDIIKKSTPVRTTNFRCQAITKKGTQCKRKAQPGSNYCWQHQR